MKKIVTLLILLPLLLTGCSTKQDRDLKEIKKEIPRSILVVMPTNKSNDIKASYTVLSQVTYPLSEAGYYVLPVVVIDEIFKQNGVTVADDIQMIPTEKLYKTFNADAALYLDVLSFGTSYQIIQSDTRVSVKGKLIDLRNGKQLWSGAASASTADNNNSINAGLISTFVQAAVSHVYNTMTEKSYDISDIAVSRLFTTTNKGNDNNLLFGPRSPNFETQQQK